MGEMTICGIGSDGVDSGRRCDRPNCVRCNGMTRSPQPPQTDENGAPVVPDDLRAEERHAFYARHVEVKGVALAVWVVPMMFTTRVMIGVPGSGFVDDMWCYDEPARAVIEAILWDPAVDREPNGWKRHPPTGRRRPGGDPDQEYVEP